MNMHYLDYDLIKQPAAPEGEGLSVFVGSSDLLVIYPVGAEREAFLGAILKAAGFDQAAEQVTSIRPEDGNQALDLSALLLCQPKIRRIIVFGMHPEKLGLHFQVSNYAPIIVNGRTYLLADDLAVIQSEKAAGKAQKAGALWRAVKAAFTHQVSSTDA